MSKFVLKLWGESVFSWPNAENPFVAFTFEFFTSRWNSFQLTDYKPLPLFVGFMYLRNFQSWLYIKSPGEFFFFFKKGILMLKAHPTQIKIARGRAQESVFFKSAPHYSNKQLLFGATNTVTFPLLI